MSQPESSRLPQRLRVRGLLWTIGGLGFVVSVFTIYYTSALFPHYQHSEFDKRMQSEILRLAENRPEDLTDDQWAYCILWTWSLHGNYGYSYISTSDLERLTVELHRRIDAGPSVATIDWYWDEYLKAVPRARNYDHFRPTSAANRADFKGGHHGGNPLSQWRSNYLRRTDGKTL